MLFAGDILLEKQRRDWRIKLMHRNLDAGRGARVRTAARAERV